MTERTLPLPGQGLIVPLTPPRRAVWSTAAGGLDGAGDVIAPAARGPRRPRGTATRKAPIR